MISKCQDKLIMRRLNINSVRNKFDALSLIVKSNVDSYDLRNKTGRFISGSSVFAERPLRLSYRRCNRIKNEVLKTEVSHCS